MVETKELTPLETVLRSYQRYYDIERENPAKPFSAEATFQTNDEAYFLIKSARIAESQSKEFVFFAEEEMLDEAKLEKLDAIAWETGISRVKPHKDHRNSDITLVILAGQVTEGAKKKVKKLKHYKSYKYGFQGWSHYKLIVLEIHSATATYNRQGCELKKLYDNIVKTF
ncbi:MAG: hypothetical protein MJ097_06910 [Dorea sp.]|nr:hypothetical protein [Dorea sp.]